MSRNTCSSQIRWMRWGIAIALFTVWACAEPVEYHGRKVGGGLIFWGIRSEMAMGQQLIAELEAEDLPYVEDPVIVDNLHRITQRLIAAVPSQFPKYPFNFAVIDDCVVNAFALPGGPIRVHRGLLRKFKAESQLAGVLAHEMGHVLGRHGTKKMSDMYLKLGLLATATIIADAIESGKCKKVNEDECSKTWTTIVGVVGYMGIMLSNLAYSRDSEREADWIGAHLMLDAGYDPEGLAQTFEMFYQMKQEQGVANNWLNRILSTHPPDLERARRVRQVRTERVSSNASLIYTTSAFDQMLRALDALPRARELDAMTAIQCRTARVTCDDRRQECYGRLLLCDPDKEDCDTIRQQCQYLEQQCLQVRKQCREYDRFKKTRPPRC